MVILVHYYSSSVEKLAPDFYQFYVNMAGVAVDLFFVISGFLIGGILLDHQRCGATIKTFYYRRSFRILPLYWLALYLAFEPFSGANYAGPTQVSFLAYFFFQQNLSIALGFWAPAMLAPLWSLAVEEHFYAVAPLMFRWLSIRNILIVILSIILLTPVAREVVTRWNPPRVDQILHKLPVLRLDAIAFGILGALLWRNATALRIVDENKKALAGGSLLLGGVTLACYNPVSQFTLEHVSWVRSIAQGAFFLSLIFLCLLKNDGWVARVSRLAFLRWCGVRCYFLYVFHFPIRDLLYQFSNRQVHTLVSILACLIFAEFSWRLIEKPMINYAKRWRYAPQKGLKSGGEEFQAAS